MSSPAIPPYIDAVPINAITAGGFGPLALKSPTATKGPAALRDLQASSKGVMPAIRTAGVIGVQILQLVTAYGGEIRREVLDAQTAYANPARIEAALARLRAARLVELGPAGTVRLAPGVADRSLVDAHSLADANAATNDDLADICRALAISTPKLKAERVAAIAHAFADAKLRRRIIAELSFTSRNVLSRMGETAALHTMETAQIGVEAWAFRNLVHAVRSPRGLSPQTSPLLIALYELVRRGIVGGDPSLGTMWIWREAWPLIEHPLLLSWKVAERPPVVPHRSAEHLAVPPAVASLDSMLARWRDDPPKVLKNEEPRIARTDARTLAKALKSDEATVDLLARLAISMRLVLPNEVARTGRGRNQRVDYAWKPDPDIVEAWVNRTPRHRWARLVAEWCEPRVRADTHVHLTRHLVLWELQRLDADTAYRGDDAFVNWMADHYSPAGMGHVIAECLVDLRSLGLVSTDVVALTGPGRALLADPIAAVETAAAEATHAFVQADLTVIAPPDLRHDLVTLLDRIATVESSGGATIYRLDAARVTRAVQAGDSAQSLIERLRALAGSPLPDTVVRLIDDAAARAGAAQLIAASTVVVVDDPADLTMACSIKALRLTRVGPTLAVTDVALAKVKAALEGKGVSPSVLGAPEETARRSTEQAEYNERMIEQLMATAARHGESSFAAQEAKRLDKKAKAWRDLDGRLAVPAALTLTPAAAATYGETAEHGA